MITKDDTLFLKGKGEQKDIDRRVETIRDQMEHSTSDYEKEKMQERIAKMASGIRNQPLVLQSISDVRCIPAYGLHFA